ncbi:CHAD domain-containing protein [Streptomyces sp. 8N706]|uniref:CHAD domain-containing protein n=1 Tax=Streptomyces sp. 8N706 TaxID=3457416 RepID=UPI003FD486AF
MSAAAAPAQGIPVMVAGGPDEPSAREASAALTAGDVLAGYLHGQAADFLRSLRLHRESGADAEEAVEAGRQLRRAARRIGGALLTFRPLTDTAWSDPLRAELAWLTGTLAREHAYSARLARLRAALHRLSGADQATAAGAGPDGWGRAPSDWYDLCDALTATDGDRISAARSDGRTARGATEAQWGPTAQRSASQSAAPTQRHASSAAAPAPGALTVGAARAGALLERQLTLARTRAHSAALQVLGSSRFHAVADAVAVLASEAPLDSVAAAGSPDEVLRPLADQARRQLVEAVDALPLYRAGHPYNAEALVHGLAATAAADAPPATEQQDAPWHQVRLLLRLCRYAEEVLDAADPAQSGDPSDSPVPEGATGGPMPEGSAGGPGPGGSPGPEGCVASGCRGDGGPSLRVRLTSAAQALERHRDASEAAAAAAAAARTPRIAPATAYALGVLHADQRHDVEAARFAFGRLWQRLAVSAR